MAGLSTSLRLACGVLWLRSGIRIQPRRPDDRKGGSKLVGKRDGESGGQVMVVAIDQRRPDDRRAGVAGTAELAGRYEAAWEEWAAQNDGNLWESVSGDGLAS
jgi:hypothetical protein